MGQLLGLGITHYPRIAYEGSEGMFTTLRVALNDPGVPAELKAVEAWPSEMREEWGDDEGRSAAERHRADIIEAFRHVRAELDAFQPDAVVIWGDDQYEQFQEDGVPSFCVFALDEYRATPWAGNARSNAWGEAQDTEFVYPGDAKIGRTLASGLLSRHIDTSYAYRLREGRGVPHAFTNSLLYLDWDREGFPYPVIPISVNCYGSAVISRKGGIVKASELDEVIPDPPGPSPLRCMEFGAALADTILESDLKVAVIASSSWSHAFLNDKSLHLYPDMESDREFYSALAESRFDDWKTAQVSDLEASGQQEILNWYCMLGAAERAGLTTTWSTMVESWVFNSNKAFAVLK